MRIAILGVGNELNGDDAAGVLAARQLSDRLSGYTNLLILEGGSAPENVSGPIRRFQPDWLILLDIAQMDAEPGVIGWFEMGEIDGVSAATHGLPVTMLARYLREETGCQVGAVFIQPASLEFGAPLSLPVKSAVKELVDGLVGYFGSLKGTGQLIDKRH